MTEVLLTGSGICRPLSTPPLILTPSSQVRYPASILKCCVGWQHCLELIYSPLRSLASLSSTHPHTFFRAICFILLFSLRLSVFLSFSLFPLSYTHTNTHTHTHTHTHTRARARTSAYFPYVALQHNKYEYTRVLEKNYLSTVDSK